MASTDESGAARGVHEAPPPVSLEARQLQAQAALAQPTLSKHKAAGVTYPERLAASMQAEGFAVAALDTLRPGRTIRTRSLCLDDGTHYTVSSHLFGGTFGSVSLALSQRGEPWAVKVLRTQLKPGRLTAKTSVSDMPGIERELAYMQAYMSPKVHGAKDANGNVYLFMPLLLASTHEVAKTLRRGPAHRAFVRSAIAQLAQSLQSMHADGHVHLDLKPGNAMVRNDGQVILSDFGSATTTRRSWVMPATPIFSAPECFDFNLDSFDDAKADTWSLGISALAMLHDVQDSPFGSTTDFGMRGVLRDFIDWRASLMNGNSFDMAAMARHATSSTAHEQNQSKKFSTYFGAAAKRDAHLCKLVLENLLQPEASQRATMDEVHQLVRALQPEGGDEEKAARTAVQQMAHENTTVRVVFAALRARQQAGNGIDPVVKRKSNDTPESDDTPETDDTPESSAHSTALLIAPEGSPGTKPKDKKKTPLALTVLTRIACLSIRTLDDR